MQVEKKIFIVAEIAQAHDGSLGILHSYIDALAHTGIDAIKFQVHIADAESSEFEEFRVKISYEDITRYDYWKRMEFTEEQWHGIKRHCENCNVEFFASPFSNAAVDMLERIGVKRYKIGSGELTNLVLLQKIAQTGKEIILSTGMCSFEEIDQTINFLKPYGNKISLLQCTTQYPTKPASVGLNVISELKKRYGAYGIKIGFSDHSGKIFAPLAAVALGAEIIEVHATFDRRMFGPDASASLTIDEINQLVEGIWFIEDCLRHPVDKNDASNFERLREIFGKSLSINKDLPAGHTITFDDLETKKPFGKGIPPKDFQKVIGLKLKTNKKKYDFLTTKDIEP